MIFRLDKMSSPGWDEPKDFLSETEAAQELKKHICRGCRGVDTEEKTLIPTGDPDEDFGCAYGSENLYDLLNTPCGCEYYLEEVSDDGY